MAKDEKRGNIIMGKIRKKIWAMERGREIKKVEKTERMKQQLTVLRQVNDELVKKEVKRMEEHNQLVEKLSDANKKIMDLKAENKIAYDAALKRTQEMVELKNELYFLREYKKKHEGS